MNQDGPESILRIITSLINGLTNLIAAARGSSKPVAAPADSSSGPRPDAGNGSPPTILSDGRYTLEYAGIAGIWQPGYMDLRTLGPGMFEFSSMAHTQIGPAYSRGVIRQQGGYWMVEYTQSTIPGLVGVAVPNQITARGNVVNFTSDYGLLSWAKG